MLRGFREPYRKLFSGEVFTTVRLNKKMCVIEHELGRIDALFLYPRTKRMTKVGDAEIVCERALPLEYFAKTCSEAFAQYDAEKTKDEFIAQLRRESRNTHKPWVHIITYLWRDRMPVWKSLRAQIVCHRAKRSLVEKELIESAARATEIATEDELEAHAESLHESRPQTSWEKEAYGG